MNESLKIYQFLALFRREGLFCNHNAGYTSLICYRTFLEQLLKCNSYIKAVGKVNKNWKLNK